VSLRPDRLTPHSAGLRVFLVVALFQLFSLTPSLAQDASQTDHGAPKYDSKTETQTKGVVDDIKMLPLGSRKDFVELIVKAGEDKLAVYVCPKPFQDEMEITFSKGDEVSITGSKVKLDEADVILARLLAKGSETLMFRDDKGKAIWDWRTGK
jgi:hypothetical protein